MALCEDSFVRDDNRNDGAYEDAYESDDDEDQ